MIRKLWLYGVKIYLRLGLFFYFRRIKVSGIEHIKKDEATLVLSNHQNALLDALLIASQLDHYAYFLTRAGVFKKHYISKLLMSFNMLPVYRIRDGWKNLTNNNPIFESCIQLLNDKNTVVIFPEGSHSLLRRVRPLSKGFTRIVFGTLDRYPNLPLKLVAVGVNFVRPKEFPDSTHIKIAPALDANRYLLENRAEGIAILRQEIHKQLTQLTTHIPETNYEETLARLNAMKVDYLNPEQVNSCIASNFQQCDSQVNSKWKTIHKTLKFLLILNSLLPWLFWKYYVQPKIKELEFTATFRFAVAITLVPVYLMAVSAIITSIYGWPTGLVYLGFSLLLALAATKL